MMLLIALLLAQTQPLTGIGTGYFSRNFALSTTSACVTTSTTTSTCLLFPAEWGLPSDNAKRWVQIDGGAIAANCCFTLDDGGIDITGLSISDPPTYSGPGSHCFRVQALVQGFETKPNGIELEYIGQARRAPGSVAGFCSNLWGGLSAGNDQVYAPCDVDGDCSAFGGGTCTSMASITDAQKQRAGARLFCEADSGTPTIYITKLKEKYTR